MNENVNDAERGVAVRMPMPNLDVIGYRCQFQTALSDGTMADVIQLRPVRGSVKDDELVLASQAEQLLGLCDYLQDQLMIATGGMRFAHHYLKAVAASLSKEGVVMNSEDFTARNEIAVQLAGKMQTMVNEAMRRGPTFLHAAKAGFERYSEVTGEPADPLVRMAMMEVMHATMMEFLKTHLE